MPSKILKPHSQFSRLGMWTCHRNFGPENFGPGDQNFEWKIGPAGPIFSGKMVRLWKIGPGPPPSPAHQDGLSLAKCLTSAHVT